MNPLINHTTEPILYPDAPLKALQWTEGTMARLFYDGETKVIGGLNRMQPKKDAIREEFRKHLVSGKQRPSHRLRPNRKGGYAIGSGGIESANKFTCHVRMKRSGAWWLKENGNGVLALRCALMKAQLDDAFRGYVVRDQQKRLALYTNT